MAKANRRHQIDGGSEEYVVKFMLKNGEYWTDKVESVFFDNGKSRHTDAEKEIRRRYRGQDIKIKAVIYQ